jgi:hypothetical protein
VAGWRVWLQAMREMWQFVGMCLGSIGALLLRAVLVEAGSVRERTKEKTSRICWCTPKKRR